VLRQREKREKAKGDEKREKFVLPFNNNNNMRQQELE
jgi:hypothetical protein